MVSGNSWVIAGCPVRSRNLGGFEKNSRGEARESLGPAFRLPNF